MKNNKLFWPVVILSLIVLIEGVIFMSRTQKQPTPGNLQTTERIEPSEVKEEPVISFGWKQGTGLQTLTVTAQKEISLDGMDLYIDYKGVEKITVRERGSGQNMVYSGVDEDNSRVVVKYYVKATDGLKLDAGEMVELLDINYQPIQGQEASFSINPSSLVVENGTVKTLPYL